MLPLSRRPERILGLCPEFRGWDRTGPRSGKAAAILASPTWETASEPSHGSSFRQCEKSIRLPPSRQASVPVGSVLPTVGSDGTPPSPSAGSATARGSALGLAV